jgi:hypothetical protein
MLIWRAGCYHLTDPAGRALCGGPQVSDVIVTALGLVPEDDLVLLQVAIFKEMRNRAVRPQPGRVDVIETDVGVLDRAG